MSSILKDSGLKVTELQRDVMDKIVESWEKKYGDAVLWDEGYGYYRIERDDGPLWISIYDSDCALNEKTITYATKNRNKLEDVGKTHTTTIVIFRRKHIVHKPIRI
jgi:hypothetical protein